MSTLLDSTHENEDITSNKSFTLTYCYNNNKYPKHVLKPKNIFKSNSKCSKALKRKLKKYKLRKDGKEDQDIIDVSKSLLSTLKIVSPRKTSEYTSDLPEDEFVRPRHYLYKMARRKLKTKSECASTVQSVEPKDNKEQSSKVPSPTKNTDEKTHTNAFKLMMEARNKSIGSNSPGKDVDKTISESPEVIEKKNIKVKRNLALQKMAEAKGLSKKKQIEEYQEECIKRKMEARAERLKNMITKNGKIKQNENKVVVKSDEKIDDKDTASSKEKLTEKDTISDLEVNKKPSKTLTLVSIFSNEIATNSKPKKKVSKEDEEFLKKLSPSIKKKENMLSYFKKLDKEPEVNIDVVDNEDENTSSIIKVKMTPKNKKKIKSKKLQLKKRVSNEILKDHNEISTQLESKTITEVADVIDTSNNIDRRKRKRKNYVSDDNKTKPSEELKDLNIEERPKRNRKPIKYVDDVQLTSSDDELLIFTPKKRRQAEIKKNYTETKIHKAIDISEDESVDAIIEITDKKDKKTKLNVKKPTKLAPIFATKPQLSQEELEAKQKFLQSGIPDQLKKIIAKQKKDDVECTNSFLTVVHVQQLEPIGLSTSSSSLYDSNDDYEEEIFIKDDSIFNKLLNFQDDPKVSAPAHKGYQTVLQNIKESYPKFPVHRTYKLLKGKSRGEFNNSICPNLENSVEIINDMNDSLYESPDKLTWTDKYKPTLSSQIIGNFASIKELKKWLISWTENDNKTKYNNAESDSSDFCYSDTDSRDHMKYMNNLLVLTGPSGSGKTSSVYAVAAELAFKVIEVNASNKRTGKMMLQDLQEATQSHKVNRGNSGTEHSQKSQEPKNKFVLKTYKKKGRPKKVIEEPTKKEIDKNENLSQQSTSQEKARTGMSLILIDDADIVFEQDDGFASAVSQLIHSSKRPVILVTSSLMCPHLQKFIQYGKTIKLKPLLPKILGTWLDIMCLADTGLGWHGLGEKFLNYFKGDIRKTINYLQFYLVTHTKSIMDDDSSQQNSESYKPQLEDETSSMSWVDQGDSENLEQEKHIESIEISVGSSDDAWKYFLNSQLSIQSCRMPFALFNCWWSIPNIFDAWYSKNTSLPSEKSKTNSIQELECISGVLDTLSVADNISCVRQHNREDVTSQPWKGFESDSVSELEDPKSYNKHFETNNEIVHDLILRSVANSQKTLGIEKKTDLEFPGMEFERKRKEIVQLHDGITHCLNPSVTLDRRSLALDYWSSCRAISRIERTKVDTVSKRNNRFCHYLKSLNIFCKNDSYDNLANSLASKTDL